MVHLEALKNNLVGLPRHVLPNVWVILKDRGIIIAPLIAIVYLLISGKSPFLSASGESSSPFPSARSTAGPCPCW